jgi:hypothetical protein
MTVTPVFANSRAEMHLFSWKNFWQGRGVSLFASGGAATLWLDPSKSGQVSPRIANVMLGRVHPVAPLFVRRDPC